MPVIVSIIGRNGSGKSTAALHYEQRMQAAGIKTLRLSFAEPLKAIASSVGITKKDRDKLEQFSDSMKTNLGQDIFARVMLDRIDASDADVIIVDDMRYAVEYDTLSLFYPVITMHNRRKTAEQLDNNPVNDIDRLNVLLMHIATHGRYPVHSSNDLVKDGLAFGRVIHDIAEIEVEEPKVEYKVTEQQGMLGVELTDGISTTVYKVVAGPDIDLGAIDGFIKEEIAAQWKA